MSDYEEEFDESSVSSPKQEGQPSWLRPLNKRAASPSEVSPVNKTPSSEASIPPTPPSSGPGTPKQPAAPPREAPPPDSDDYSQDDRDSLAEPSTKWTNVQPPAHSTTSGEIAELRRRNAELQAAVQAVKEQLSNVAPKLDAAVRRKHSAENERMNKLQEETAALKAEHARLRHKLKEVEHVTALEKQLKDREAEVRAIAERNKALQVEIRNNTKKLKQMATIEDQRARMLAVIKQELKVAENAVAKADRDAELAVQAREGAAQRLRVLESKDRVPELKPEDVRQLIDMKQALAAKQETIEALQYRLSVLKKAHESAQRNILANPTDTSEIESLRFEVANLKARLAAGRSPSAQDARTPEKSDKSEVAGGPVHDAQRIDSPRDDSVSETSHRSSPSVRDSESEAERRKEAKQHVLTKNENNVPATSTESNDDPVDASADSRPMDPSAPAPTEKPNPAPVDAAKANPPTAEPPASAESYSSEPEWLD